MKLIIKKEQDRRDFIGLYECENCKTTIIIKGYDDRNFHDNVAPRIKCSECNNTTLSLNIIPQYIQTKYPALYVIKEEEK